MVHWGKIIKYCSPFSASAGLIAINNPEGKEFKIIVNYNGQADLLISLQIPPDYYPYQFKKNSLYDYLVNVDKYLVTNQDTSSEKLKIKRKLQARLNQLFKKVIQFGDGLWDKNIYESGLMFRNDQFWNTKKTNLLFLEQFIVDDYTNIRDAYSLLPIHKKLIITNHRAARDPYTVFSRDVYECIKDANCQKESRDFANKLDNYLNNYQNNYVNALYRYGKYIHFWNNLNEIKKFEKEIKDWTYNNNFLFSQMKKWDIDLAKRYQTNIFTSEELKKIRHWNKNRWSINYLNTKKNNLKLMHHPIMEQQKISGSAPISEGSQKDMMIFLFQFAALIDKYVKEEDFKTSFKNDYREKYMKTAFKSARIISKNLKNRLKNIREYFKKIGVVDPSFDPETNNFKNKKSKSFGIINFAPRNFGTGESSLLTISKYPFIYHDIGLRQEFPNTFVSHHSEHEGDHEHNEELEEEIFSVDDNGWWWNLGNANLNADKLLEFQRKLDKLLIISNKEDWNLISNEISGVIKYLGTMIKHPRYNSEMVDINKINTKKYAINYSDYQLWNEGVRSPIALNLLLDNLVDIFQKQYDWQRKKAKTEYSAAMDWGKYWSEFFVNGKVVNDEN